MRIASAVAGFTLGEADVLRAAMGKKDKPKMAKQREKFLAGATSRGVSEEHAKELFDLIAFFAGYGFGKAHAVCYALIGYQTAYLKANHPLEYMCALLNSRADNFDKLKQSIVDAHARGLVVRPPEINRSAAAFAIGDAAKGEILYGLKHIKNVGERVAEAIVAARQEGGPFSTLLDLCLRTGVKDLNRRVLEALIRSGACDALGERGELLRLIDRVIDRAAQIRRERDSGQTALFGDAVEVAAPAPAYSLAIDADGAATGNGTHGIEPVAADERLRWEREFLGIYLSDHPLRRISAELQQRVDTSVSELGPHLDGLLVHIGGAVRDIRTFVPKRSTTGQRMAFLQVEDLTGACEVVVFPRTFEECSELLRPDAVVVIHGKVEAGRGSGGVTVAPAEDEERFDIEPAKILAESVYAYDDPRLAGWRRNSTVHVRISPPHTAALQQLRHVLQQHRGGCPVVLHVHGTASVDQVTLPDEFAVEPGPGLERAIEVLVGDGAYRMEIHRARAPERELRGAARTNRGGGAPQSARASSWPKPIDTTR